MHSCNYICLSVWEREKCVLCGIQCIGGNVLYVLEGKGRGRGEIVLFD